MAVPLISGFEAFAPGESVPRRLMRVQENRYATELSDGARWGGATITFLVNGQRWWWNDGCVFFVTRHVPYPPDVVGHVFYTGDSIPSFAPEVIAALISQNWPRYPHPARRFLAALKRAATAGQPPSADDAAVGAAVTRLKGSRL